VNELRWNYEHDGGTARSVVQVLAHKEAQCIEGAFIAACGLWLAGHAPLLMDMGRARGDVDHIAALFRRGRHWGAISKSNSPFLRYRDPILPQPAGTCALLLSTVCEGPSQDAPHVFGGRRPPPIRPGPVGQPRRLLRRDGGHPHGSRHFSVLPRGMTGRHLRPIDEIEARSNTLKDY